MLVLSRRSDESLLIQLDPKCPPHTTVAELFAQGPIQVTVLASGLSFARLGIHAPAGLQILRSELAAANPAPGAMRGSSPGN